MALLDAQFPVHKERSYASAFHGGRLSPAQLSSQLTDSGGRGGGSGETIRCDMPTPLTSSASSGSIAQTQPSASAAGLPTSSSTAELVALGLISTADATEESDPTTPVVDSAEYSSSDGGGYDPLPPIPTSSRNGSGGMVGSTNGGTAGLDATAGGGGQTSVSGGTDMSGGVVTGGPGARSTGGMGLGVRNQSLTNLAMGRSQSVSSFPSDLFAGGAGTRMTAPEAPSWGSYPANLDKAGGASSTHAFTMSPATGPIGGSGGGGTSATGASGASSRASSGLRASSAGAEGGSELSPAQFTGRGTAPRREVERGVSAWPPSLRSSQRRPVGTSVDHGGVPPGRSGGGTPSGRAMVHNRSDTDLVASFSRLGFGHGGITRWSPHMSPTASPLGAPLLEEDPLDLELEESAHEAAGGDTFATVASPRGQGHRSGISLASSASGAVARLPRHASYPSLTLSHGSYGMGDLVQGAFADLTVGDNTGGASAESAGSGAAGSGGAGTLSASSMSSGSLSGSSSRANGRVGPSGVNTGSSGASVSGVTVSTTSALSTTGSRTAGGYSPTTGTGTPATLSPGHSHSPATSAQRAFSSLRQTPPDGGRTASQGSRHRASHGAGHAGSPSTVSVSSGGAASASGGAAVHGHRPNTHAYDQGRAVMGGVDGVMMTDGRFVPSSNIYQDGPHMMFGDGFGAGGGYDNMAAGAHGMDVPWHISQDPVSLYQALLMKQSLAAAHASGMRFPNMLPVANGMGVSMMDMATLAAAAQAAAGGRSGYGGVGGAYGGHLSTGIDGHVPGGYGRRDSAPMRGSAGPRSAGMGGMEVGYVNHMGHMGEGRGGGMMGMGRGGGMYDIVEDVGDGNVYQVQFKRSTRNFLLGKNCQRDLQVSSDGGGRDSSMVNLMSGYCSRALHVEV